MNLREAIDRHLGIPGRLISASKSGYARKHPGNTVYFNACIFDKDGTQVWWGDLDLTEERDRLDSLAEECQETFYVTPEHGFRSDFNEVTTKMLKKDPRVVVFNA